MASEHADAGDEAAEVAAEQTQAADQASALADAVAALSERVEVAIGLLNEITSAQMSARNETRFDAAMRKFEAAQEARAS